MAKNKKPAKRYNPLKFNNRPSRIMPDEAFRTFQPVRLAVSMLRSGEVPVDRGYPVMKDWMGDWVRMDVALEGWANCWDRLFGAIDCSALRKLAKKLENGVLLNESELDDVDRLLDLQQAAFVRMDSSVVLDKMRTEEIAIELDSLGLREAA